MKQIFNSWKQKLPNPTAKIPKNTVDKERFYGINSREKYIEHTINKIHEPKSSFDR